MGSSPEGSVGNFTRTSFKKIGCNVIIKKVSQNKAGALCVHQALSVQYEHIRECMPACERQ